MSFNPENHSNLFRKKNVNQIFPGKKHIKGKSTDTNCLVFGVSKKINKEHLNEEDIIPQLVDGLPTDVVELPIFNQEGICPEINIETNLPVCSDHARILTGKQSNCLLNGTSIGSEYDAGTLGIPIFNSKNNSVLGLTCNHTAGGTARYPVEEKGRSFLVKPSGEDYLFSQIKEDGSESQFYSSPAFNQTEGIFSRLESGMVHSFIGGSGASEKPLLLYSDYSTIYFLSINDLLELTGRQYNEPFYGLPFTTSINVGNNTQTVFSILPFSQDLSVVPAYSSESFSDRKVIDINQSKFSSSEEFLNYFSNKESSQAFEILTDGVRVFDSNNTLTYDNGPILETKPLPTLSEGEKLEIYVNPDGSNYTETGYFYGFSPSNGGSKIHNVIEFLYFGIPPCFSKNHQDTEEEYLNTEILEHHAENYSTPIFYPAPFDATEIEPKQIGKSKPRPIKFDHPLNTNLYSGNFISFNKLDVTFIEFLEKIIPTVHFLDLAVGDIKISDPIIGAKVFKSGRTTGATPINSNHQATITSTNWSGRVSYCNNENTVQSNAFFTDCITYNSSENFAFNLKGDSGSAVFMEHEKELHLIGIHFAGSLIAGQTNTIGLAFKIKNLLDLYQDFDIWNGDYAINKSKTDENANAYKICSDCYMKSTEGQDKNFLPLNVSREEHSTFENIDECY